MAKRQTKVLSSKKSSCTWEIALHNFLYWKQAQGVSDTTVDDYKRHITHFYKRYPDSWMNESMKQSLLEYLAYKIMPATFNLRLIYLRTFYNWCIEEGYMVEIRLKDLRSEKRSPELLI